MTISNEQRNAINELISLLPIGINKPSFYQIKYAFGNKEASRIKEPLPGTIISKEKKNDLNKTPFNRNDADQKDVLSERIRKQPFAAQYDDNDINQVIDLAIKFSTSAATYTSFHDISRSIGTAVGIFNIFKEHPEIKETLDQMNGEFNDYGEEKVHVDEELSRIVPGGPSREDKEYIFKREYKHLSHYIDNWEDESKSPDEEKQSEDLDEEKQSEDLDEEKQSESSIKNFFITLFKSLSEILTRLMNFAFLRRDKNNLAKDIKEEESQKSNPNPDPNKPSVKDDSTPTPS